MKLKDILTEVEKESYRTLLRFLLKKPNTDNFFGKEEKIFTKNNAFTYTTRNSNPKEYKVDVEMWKSDKGIRCLALDGDYILCASMIKDNVVTGIITDDGFENVGIGTNLLKFVKKEIPSIKFDSLRSTQGKNLIKRVGESIYDRSDMPQIQGSDLKDAFNVLKKAGIPVSVVKVIPSKLRHSQKTVNKKKVMGLTKSISQGKNIPPIVISEDNYIVDGHHRQLAYAVIEPDKEIPVIQIGLPRDKAIAVYKNLEKYMEQT